MTENQALDRILVVGAEEARLKDFFATHPNLQEVIEKEGLQVVELDHPVEPEIDALQSVLDNAQMYEMLEPYKGDIHFDDTPFYKKIGQKGGKKRKRRFY